MYIVQIVVHAIPMQHINSIFETINHGSFTSRFARIILCCAVNKWGGAQHNQFLPFVRLIVIYQRFRKHSLVELKRFATHIHTTIHSQRHIQHTTYISHTTNTSSNGGNVHTNTINSIQWISFVQLCSKYPCPHAHLPLPSLNLHVHKQHAHSRAHHSTHTNANL